MMLYSVSVKHLSSSLQFQRWFQKFPTNFQSAVLTLFTGVSLLIHDQKSLLLIVSDYKTRFEFYLYFCGYIL